MDKRKHSSPPHVSAEHLVRAVATRHGFRTTDYALKWDEGEFDPTRSTHELVITTRDGRHASVRIEAQALGQQNPWTYFPRVESALSNLRRKLSDRAVSVE